MKKLLVLIFVLFASLNSYSAGLVESKRIIKKSYSDSKVVKKEIRKVSKFQNDYLEHERNFFEVLSVSLKNIGVKFLSIIIGDFLNFSHDNSGIKKLQTHKEVFYKV